MEYVSDYIKSVVDSVETMGAGLAPPLESRPLAGLMETTFDATSLRSDKKSIVYVTAVGSGETTLIETGANDVTLQMVAYLMVVEPDSEQRTAITQGLLMRLLGHISGQRWGLPYAHPAAAVEATDLHGLTKGFKPDTSSWRLGVSVLAHAADLHGGDQADSRLSLWAITWEQKLRVDYFIGATEPQQSEVVVSRVFDDTVKQKVEKYNLEITR